MRASTLAPLLAVFSILSLGAAAPAMAAESAPAAAPARNKDYPNLEEVILVWMTHLDIGYTHPAPEVIASYRTRMMDKALALIDESANLPKDEQFVWMLPAWAMELVLDDKQDPARRARIEKAVKDGRLIWHALPYTFEAEAGDAEELVRGLGYGTRLGKHFGMPAPSYAKLTDMPEQAWILPTLLQNAGIRFVHIGCNPGSKPMRVPTLSWWEGADGSRVLLGYSAYYGWGQMPPKNWPHKAWLGMAVTNDNSGPPSAQEVKNILAYLHKQLPGVRVRFGTPGDFADAIFREEKTHPTLPVIRGDMPDTWVHGQMSCPQSTLVHRHAAPALESLGQLDTTLQAFGLKTDPVEGLLKTGYEKGGFYGEHTWGINGGFQGSYGEAFKKRMAAGGYKKSDATYEYHMNYAYDALAAAQQGLTPRMVQLAQAVKVEGPRVVVFNPLPWVRDAQVEVELPKDASGRLSRVTDVENKPVAFTVEDTHLRFAAKQLPAGGYQTYAVQILPETLAVVRHQHLPVKFSNNTLDTPHFTATFDLERGGITSLKDKSTGRELVDSSSHALGQFLHERFSSSQVWNFVGAYARQNAGGWVNNDFGKHGMPNDKQSPYLATTPKNWQAQVSRGPLADTVTLTPTDTLGLAAGYALTFSFPRDRACVDIAWSVKDKTMDPIPEGGWLCLPFKVEAPAFRIGRVGGSIDPAKDIVIGANRFLLAVDRGITVRAGATGAGMAAASADLPLWSAGQPGLWKYSDDYVPTKPELFVNLYNNMWSTNYPLWVGGSWQAKLRVWPVADGASEEQSLFTPSWEVRQPALAAYADGHGGTLPATQSGVALSRKGVRVTAFDRNPDGNGTVLRLWEQAGTAGDITVTLPTGFKATKAQPVNLRGEPSGKAVEVKEGRFSADLGAWAPKSWMLE